MVPLGRRKFVTKRGQAAPRERPTPEIGFKRRICLFQETCYKLRYFETRYEPLGMDSHGRISELLAYIIIDNRRPGLFE